MELNQSKYTIVNGEFLPENEAFVRITDLAIQRGYGIFDFFKLIDDKPIFLEDHLDRFYQSASQMHLPVALNRSGLKALIYELIKKNNIGNSGIRITLTGGYSPDGYALSEPNLILTQQALTLSTEINHQGISLISHSHLRQMPHVKTIDYLMAIWLQPLIKQYNAQDVLYFHEGMAKECPRANFFIINRDKELITSGVNVLKGVIRKQVLDLCKNWISHREAEISMDDILNAEEAFITSSTKNILPVTKIDGHKIGKGTAGEISTGISKKLQALIADCY